MELNRDQIVKALECCTATDKSANCPIGCPFGDINSCEESLMYHALALIKELTEDNEMLSNSCVGLMQRCIKLERESASLSDIVENYRVELGETRVALAEANNDKRELAEENERLRVALNTDISIVRINRGSGKTSHLREVGRIRVDAIKAYAVREMAERIKEYFPYDADSGLYVALDQITKEMIEGGGRRTDDGNS